MTATKSLLTSLGLSLLLPTAPVLAAPAGPPTAAAAEEHAGHAGHAGHGESGGHDPKVHRFTDPKKWAQEFDAPDRDGWQKPKAIVAALGLQPGMTVVDLGAGTGYFEPHLHAAVAGPGPGGRAGQVWAVDIEAPMVEYLRARAEREKLTTVQARKATPDDPQLPPASVDRVLAVDVWHHIPERPAYARKLAAALKPGGAVLVVDFKLDAKKGPPRQHRLTPQAIAADLAAAGLVVGEPAPELGLAEQYGVIARKPPAPSAPPATGSKL